MALLKLVFQITQEASKTPFDLRHRLTSEIYPPNLKLRSFYFRIDPPKSASYQGGLTSDSGALLATRGRD